MTQQSGIRCALKSSLHGHLLGVLATICLSVPTAGWADSDGIEPFVGVYEGVAVTDPAGVLTPRDIGVKIRRERDDFIVDWHSVLTDGDAVRRENHEVHFQRNPRHVGGHENYVYREALQPSISGAPRPSDPMRGESYFWARITDATLTIYRMLINDEGSQDLQIYRFTLAGDRMRFHFKHMRDEKQLQSVKGVLEKVAKSP